MLGELKPRGAGPELRAQILDMVDSELTRPAGSRFWRLAVPALAASIALAFGANIWLNDRQDQRLAALYGQQSSHQMADTPHQGLFAERPALADHFARIDRFLRELDSEGKGKHREKAKEDSQDRSARPGGSDCFASRGQRHLHLDHGSPA